MLLLGARKEQMSHTFQAYTETIVKKFQPDHDILYFIKYTSEYPVYADYIEESVSFFHKGKYFQAQYVMSRGKRFFELKEKEA